MSWLIDYEFGAMLRGMEFANILITLWCLFCAACGLLVLLFAGYTVKWVAAEYGLSAMAVYATGWCVTLLIIGLWIDNRAKQ